MRRHLPLIAGTILLIVFLSRMDLRGLAPLAVRFSPLTALFIVLLSGACCLVKTLRWTRFLSREGVSIPFRQALLSVSAGFFLGLVTPGTAGELARAWSLPNQRETGLAILALEKFCDLATLAALASLALCAHSMGFQRLLLLAGCGLLAVCAGYHFFFLRRGRLSEYCRHSVTRLARSLGGEPGLRTYERFQSLASEPRKLAASALYSLALWSLSLLQVALIYRGLGARPEWSLVALSYFLPYFIGVVSMVPFGLGTFDMSLREVIAAASQQVPGDVGSLVPVFFRALVTAPLVVVGYLCQAAASFTFKLEHRRRGSGSR